MSFCEIVTVIDLIIAITVDNMYLFRIKLFNCLLINQACSVTTNGYTLGCSFCCCCCHCFFLMDGLGVQRVDKMANKKKANK